MDAYALVSMVALCTNSKDHEEEEEEELEWSAQGCVCLCLCLCLCVWREPNPMFWGSICSWWETAAIPLISSLSLSLFFCYLEEHRTHMAPTRMTTIAAGKF